MKWLWIGLFVLSLIGLSKSQGNQWDPEDLKVIQERLELFMRKENSKKYQELALEWNDIWQNRTHQHPYKNPGPDVAITMEDLKRGKFKDGSKIPTGEYNGMVKEGNGKGPLGKFKFGSFPNAAKFLRLGFHDCLKYKDGTFGIDGCDGCLNPKYINYKLPNYGTANGNVKGNPVVGETDNNNLLQTADVLEEIYTNKDWPVLENGKTLSKSMKDKGYSRADLWAFAAVVAVQHGIHQNNYACNPDIQKTCSQNCGHIRRHEGEDCYIDWEIKKVKKLLEFRTGRRDCTPDVDQKVKRWRPYFSDRAEIHPNFHANGSTILAFYEDNFGFNDKEAIALNAGAHSMGKFSPAASYLTYFWTKDQHLMLNNQVLRNLSNKTKSYFIDCPNLLIGDEYGQPAETLWKVNNRKRSDASNTALGTKPNRGVGPFQWVHSYNRY